MTQLAAFPEGSGSALDNTLIVWCSEVANPLNHQPRTHPLYWQEGLAVPSRWGVF